MISKPTPFYFFSIISVTILFVSVIAQAQPETGQEAPPVEEGAQRESGQRPNGASTIGDYEPKECFNSDFKRLPFADMTAIESGTRAYAFHPLGTDIDVVTKAVEIFKQAQDCDEAKRDYENAKIKHGENSPEAEKAKDTMCTDVDRKEHIKQAQLVFGSYFPKLQSWTKTDGQHNTSPWPQSVPVSVTSVSTKRADLTFVLEERVLKYGYDHFNRQFASDLSRLAGDGELSDAPLGAARIALYNGDEFIRDYDLDSVIYPTSVYAFRDNDKQFLVVLDKIGGDIVEHYAYDVKDDKKELFEEGSVHYFEIVSDQDGNVSLLPLKTLSSGGIHPNNFLRHEGKFVVVNQGGFDKIRGSHNPAFGTVMVCNNEFESCDSSTVRSDEHLQKGWLHGHPWHSDILGDRVYFTDLNLPNLFAEVTFGGSQDHCKENLKQISDEIEGDLQALSFLCEGPVGVVVDVTGKKVTIMHGGTQDVHDNLAVITESALLPEGDGTEMLRHVTSEGEIHFAPSIKKIAYVINGQDGYDLLFHFDMKDGEAPNTYVVSMFKGGAQGIVNLWFEGEMFEKGGFKARVESANSSWVGEYHLASGEVDYHHIKTDLPIRHLGGDGHFFKHEDSKRQVSMKLGVGHSWSALERIFFKGAGTDGGDLEVLGLGSLNSLDAIAITRDEAGHPKAIGMWTPSTDSYASRTELLYDPEKVRDLINFAVFNRAYTPSDVTAAAVAAANSITTLFGGLNDLKFFHGGEDFDLMARFGFPIDLVSQVVPAPKLEAGKQVSWLPDLNIGGVVEPPVVRFGRLYLELQSLWGLPQAWAQEEKAKQKDDFDDEEGWQVARNGIPQVRFPSQITCSSVGPYVPFDEEIFDDPSLPGVAGIDSLGITPTFLALRFPMNCRIVDLATGTAIIANASQHSELFDRCVERTQDKFDPKGKKLELANLIADHLWHQDAGQMKDSTREEIIAKLAKLRGRPSVIEEVVSTLQGAQDTEDGADLLEPVDDDWHTMWELAACGKLGCYNDHLRGMAHISTKLAAQGATAGEDQEPYLSVSRGQVAFTVPAATGGGGCSLRRHRIIQ